MNNRPEIVIVGGGFGGISAAKALRKTNCNITLVDKRNHHLFQPLLYQVATAALSPGDIAVPIRAIFGNDNNVRTVLGEVVSIDKTDNCVHLADDSSIKFDYLILAPGAIYNYFGNERWKSHAPGLKTLKNALSVRERILISLEEADKLDDPLARKKYLTYAVIGAGPTGVEMAGAIAEIAKRNMMRDFRNIKIDETEIFLIEAASNVLNGYPEDLSNKAKSDLEEMGVKVLLNNPVKSIREDGVELENSFIETPNIIWAAGVKASPLLESLHCKLDKMGRAVVEGHLNIPDHDSIFVIGDAAHVKGEDGQPLPALAPVALQQGKYLAKLIQKCESGKSTSSFKYVDKGTMATIGRAKAVADIRGLKFSGFLAWMLWSVIHIFFLIGFRNRFRVFAEWMWHYLTFKRGVRLITNEPDAAKTDSSDES